MSLLTEFVVQCVRMTQTTQDDGEGGQKSTWTEGDGFNAVILLDTSQKKRIAEKDEVTSIYTVTTTNSVTLAPDDVFKRKSDGQTFRVTSDASNTPGSAHLDMRQVSAEECALT